MEDFQLLYKILFSLGIGFIIGMEREYKAKEDIFAGVRTFPLIALLGVLSSFLSERYWEGILYIAFAGVVLFSLLNFYLEYSKDRGITTEISVLITFLTGVAVYYEYYYIAGVVGILLMFILAIKKPLEEFTKHLYYEDIISVVKFLTLTVLIYPILPDRYFGPFEFFNPKEIWKAIMIVTVIDFLGYILLRWKGQRSLLMVGILGGLISSTAVTYNFSKLSKELNTVTLFLGIVLSWSVMNLRVVFLATFIDVNLFSHLIVPFLTLTGLYLVVAYLYYKKTDLSESIEYPGVSRPFSILSILQFGALYTFIFFMGKVLSFYLGN